LQHPAEMDLAAPLVEGAVVEMDAAIHLPVSDQPTVKAHLFDAVRRRHAGPGCKVLKCSCDGLFADVTSCELWSATPRCAGKTLLFLNDGPGLAGSCIGPRLSGGWRCVRGGAAWPAIRRAARGGLHRHRDVRKLRVPHAAG